MNVEFDKNLPLSDLQAFNVGLKQLIGESTPEEDKWLHERDATVMESWRKKHYKVKKEES